MAAGNTYTPIATQTTSSAVASVTFSSISGAYTDLVLVIDGKNTGSGYTWGLQYNSDTAANYSWTMIEGSGSAATTSRGSGSGAVGQSIYFTYNQGISDSLSNAIISIQNYANTTTFKTNLIRQNNPVSTNAPGLSAVVGMWRNTAAITSITLMIPGGGTTIASGTTLSLYGIVAA
jgi:hypothetical protein